MSIFSNFLNKVTGRQAYLDSKKAKEIKKESESKYEEYCIKTEEIQKSLNQDLKIFGELRLVTLKKTVGVFLSYLKDIEQKNKENGYEVFDGCDLPKEYIAELDQISMNTGEILKTGGTSIALAAVATMGVPTAVTGAVGSFATASTGTTISALAGAAKMNAILAWLGGGSLATGGGGVALGGTILSVTTFTATGIVALVSAGLVASSIFAKKLTKTQKYANEIDIACEKMEVSWVAMQGIKERIYELTDITKELYHRSSIQILYLEPLIPDFDAHHKYHIYTFQKTSLIIKSISELAKTPLFDDEMNLSQQSKDIIIKTKTILNTEL
ncbi:hypothetical protein EZS27_013972 [termite gut metagenome]|uniref:Uncharacterized protein n=1 Tax=termite gut metagenome TaxID=433724 RepID=A0A5J4RWJ9_9ZZZZ